jgi:glyoxylase-like metal-dependent hydrolase (beta-lactamase superfamily II)
MAMGKIGPSPKEYPMSRPLVACVLATLALAACSKKEPEAAPVAAAAPVAEAPAPAPAPVSHTYPFKVGQFAATSLHDGDPEFPNDNQVFGVGLKPEDVAAVLSANGLPTDKLKLGLDPLLVKAGDKVLLFDTGAGANFGPAAGKLPESLAEAGVDAGTVTDIFISHAHPDHVGGLVSADGKLNFPNATIHLSKPEWAHLSSQKDQAALVSAIKPKVDAFKPNADLIPGVVKAVEIKGHTPGHSGYKITSGTESLLYIGDSMHHSVVSVQKPEWTIQFDHDDAVAKASRIALVNELAASGQRVYAVHFPFPGVGKFEKRGDGAVWVAE